MSNNEDEDDEVYRLTPKGIIFCNLMEHMSQNKAMDITESLLENLRTYCLIIGIKNPAIVWEDGAAQFCNRD